MGVIFSKPKSSSLSPVSQPPPIPDEAPEAGEEAAKRARRRTGFRKTILTGALEPQTTRKQLLGG